MEEEYDIEKILNMFEEDFVIPASKMQRPQSALDREMYEDFNKRNPQADGGRIGFKKGKQATVLTPQMVIDIAEKNPDFTATDIFNKLQKDKTKNYVTSRGTPVNRKVINRTLSQTFDLQAAEKAKVPKGCISSQEFFNTEGIPISKRDYMTVKNRNPSLLTDTIGKNAVFVERGTGGQGSFYYKKPTKEDIKLYQRIASRKGQLAKNTVNLMLEFDKKFGNLYEKGELPLLKDPTGKNKNTIHNLISKDITPSTAGNVTARLSQWYNGADFINPELKDLKRNKLLGTKIQKATDKFQFGNFYKDQAYKVALDTIDEKIGRQIGSFKAFKDNIKVALKEAGLPIYSKNSPFGFNLNEIAGVTGAARTKTAAFSDFVDIAEGGFNQGKLSRFQREFAELREKLDKLNLSDNPQNKAKAQSLINDFQDTIKYYEQATGSKLPNVGLGTADQYYSAEKLTDIGKERFVGETGKKKNRIVPGTDLIKASKDAGYTVIIPENYRTVGQIMETGTRDVLKKNVQNTLDGMKEFFNEYDEKKLFKKLQEASPPVLRQMMKIIPKVASLEDDFLNAYGYPLTASLDSSIGTQPVKEEGNFITRNPYTTAGATAGAMLPFKVGRKALGKLLTGVSAPFSAGAFSLSNILDIDPNSPTGFRIQDDPNIKTAGADLLLPELSKKALTKLGGPKGIQTLLSLGKYGRMLTPLGIATIGVGLGKDYYDFAKDEIAKVKAMPEDERRAYNEALMDLSA